MIALDISYDNKNERNKQPHLWCAYGESCRSGKCKKNFKTYERASSGFLASFRRHYYTKKALISGSFSISKGQIVALLGRNGSGKSTLIKILTGILYPDSGTVNVLGFNPWKERMKLAWSIGVVLGAHGRMYWNLPAYDTFEYMQKIYKVPEEEFKKRLAHFVDILDLKHIYKKPVRTMSLGEMMKRHRTHRLLVYIL